MDPMTRRRFLLASGGVAAGAMADAAAVVTWRSLHHAARERPAVADDRVLVVVTLYGGNDGLNTVVPWSDDAYRDARPGLAYAEHDVLHLDAHFGFNPAMTGIKALWDRGLVAVVHGVGYPEPDRSHFRSMDIWQTADPDTPVPTGWIGRWLDATGDDPLRAVAIGPVLPVLAIGGRSTAATLVPGPFTPMPSEVAQFVQALGESSPADRPAVRQVASGCTAAHRADTTFARALATAAPGDADGGLGSQLGTVAAAIRAGVPTRVWSVGIGGFDTHSDELGTQQALWKSVDAAVSSFFTAVEGASQRVTMMIHSEFGRRVRANASEGTDHGTAGPVLLLGPGLRRGFHGEHPTLTDLDPAGDLTASVDFRAVYGELLGSVLGTDPHAVLGKVPPALGLIAP